MVVGVSRVEIFLPENHSLKDKRQSIKRIVEKTKTRFNVSIMEIEQTNLWQKAIIGFSVIGVNTDHVSAAIEKIQEFIEALYVGEVVDTKTEIIVIGNAI